MARDLEVERQLQQWARWRLSGGAVGLGYAAVRPMVAGGSIGREQRVEARIPINSCEAEAMDRLVHRLEPSERRTVEVNYLHPGSVGKRAAVLGIGEAALHQRIGRIHAVLRRWMADVRGAADGERARVEALIEAARP